MATLTFSRFLVLLLDIRHPFFFFRHCTLELKSWVLQNFYLEYNGNDLRNTPIGDSGRRSFVRPALNFEFPSEDTKFIWPKHLPCRGWRILCVVVRCHCLGLKNLQYFCAGLLRQSLHPAALPIICGYRTVSCDAAGLVPGHLIIEERARVWNRMEMDLNHGGATRKRGSTMRKGQGSWKSGRLVAKENRRGRYFQMSWCGQGEVIDGWTSMPPKDLWKLRFAPLRDRPPGRPEMPVLRKEQWHSGACFAEVSVIHWGAGAGSADA